MPNFLTQRNERKTSCRPWLFEGISRKTNRSLPASKLPAGSYGSRNSKIPEVFAPITALAGARKIEEVSQPETEEVLIRNEADS